jgi:hypothetical protein
MNDAPLRAPLVFASELHPVALPQTLYPRRDVNVVGDEQGLPRVECQNETLMPAPVFVVRKESSDHALTFDLKVTGALLEGATENSVAFGESPALCARRLL